MTLIQESLAALLKTACMVETKLGIYLSSTHRVIGDRALAMLIKMPLITLTNKMLSQTHHVPMRVEKRVFDTLV